MGLKFNPPPGWPLPWGFEPPPGWEPDPAWPEPPPGWPLWIGSDAPRVLYRVPAGTSYVPGYMRESPRSEPSAARRRPFKRRPSSRLPASRRPPRARGRAGGGHRRPRSRPPVSGQVALAVVGLAAVGLIAFELLTPGIKDPSGAATTSGGQRARPVNLLALRTGACFQDPARGHPAERPAGDVSPVPCTSVHNAQVYARVLAQGWRTYPGQKALERQGSRECRSMLAARLGSSKLPPSLSLIDVVPSRARWSGGQRTISCVVVDPAARLTRSLLTTHGGADPRAQAQPRDERHGSAHGHPAPRRPRR